MEQGETFTGLGKGAYGAAKGAVTGVVGLGVTAARLQMGAIQGTAQFALTGDPSKLHEVASEATAIGSAVKNEIATTVKVAAEAYKNPSLALDAATELGIEGTAEVLGGATFETATIVAGPKAAGATARVVKEGARRARTAAAAARAKPPAQISSVGTGSGGHAVVDRIAGEAQGTLDQAARILESGGANTRWAHVYQKARGTGRPREFLARRNALHQEAERLMLRNRHVQEAINAGHQVLFNRGSALGLRGPGERLLRPDIQIGLPGGRWGVIDWTTPGSAAKISKYATPETRHLVNVVKP